MIFRCGQKLTVQWITAFSSPNLTTFRIQHPGFFGPKFLQAFVVLILPDLTTPDITAKPDLKSLFSGP